LQLAPNVNKTAKELSNGPLMKSPAVLKQFWRAWLRPFLAVAAVVLPFKSAIADINFVPTGSMKPTILEGDLVFVNKLAYDLKVPFTTLHLAEWTGPARGDVVVCFSPEDGIRLVKRLVAVPGDTLELQNNVLFINGQRAAYQPPSATALTYVSKTDLKQARFATETVDQRSHAVMAYPAYASPVRSFGPVVLGNGEYFAMGDNRDNSKDSRYFGIVKRDLIVGKAVGVVASVDKPGSWLPRFGRFFSALD
jgi:signal peptidase I